MSDFFDWTTEEDESVWEEQAERKDTPPDPKKRPWRAWAILATLLIVGAGVVYWQVQKRIDIAMADVRTDLLSTHNLVNRAVAMQDVDLLAPLLSGRDMAWTRNQEKLMRDDGLFGRSALGLPLAQPPVNLVDGDERLVSLEMSPDLNEAELQFVEQYRFGEDEIPFRQTAVYRRGRERWLMSPPDEDFWGGWETEKVDGMTFVFAERDAELGKQLASDLASRLLVRCRQLAELSCPDLSGLFVRFDTDVASLVAISDLATIYDAGLRLDLPSPTLVGYPLDDTGYEVLLQVYEAQIFTAVLSEAIGYECCQHAPFMQAITDYYLAEIGLKYWPVSVATYSEIASNVLTIEQLYATWSKSVFLAPWDADYDYVYGFVDFLMSTEPDKTPIEMLQILTERQASLAGLGNLFDGRYGNRGLIQETTARDWWLYARAKAQDISAERPLPLPEQDLQIICNTYSVADVSGSILFRYDTGASTWQEEEAREAIMFLNPLPQDDGIVLQSIDFATDNWEAVLWENGIGQPLTKEDDSLLLSLGQTDPTGQYLIVFTGSPETEALLPVLQDLATCDQGNCGTLPVESVPVWSPNGEHSLLTEFNLFEDSLFKIGERIALFSVSGDVMPSPIRLGDGVGQPLADSDFVEIGTMPFWLSNEMFGYIAPVDDPINPLQELRVVQVDDRQMSTLISTTNLLHTMPEEDRPVRLTMRYVVAHPTNPNLLVVMANYQQEGYLFTVDSQSGEVSLRLRVGLQSTHMFGFSPDGRFLTVYANPEADMNARGIFNALYVHDIATNETETFEVGYSSSTPAFTFDWSADGNWLAYIYGNGFVRLYAPEFGYQELITHDFGECSSLAWVN